MLTKSIIWADNRSAEQSKRILKEMNGFDIYKRTGTPIHPMSPLSKIVWMKEQDKETFAKTAKFISMKEYILHEFSELMSSIIRSLRQRAVPFRYAFLG